MRLMFYALALLAGLKVWTQDTLFRNAAEDALVAAYRDRAIQACQKIPQKAAGTAQLWSSPESIKLVIGRKEVDVHLWEIDHPLWNARFKNPYLVVSPGMGAMGLVCEYDVTIGAAALSHV